MKASIIYGGLATVWLFIAGRPGGYAQSCGTVLAEYKSVKAWYETNLGTQPAIPTPPIIDPDCLDCSDPLQKDRNQPLVDSFNARSARPESDVIKTLMDIAKARQLAGDGGNIFPDDHNPEKGNTCYSPISDVLCRQILKLCEKRLVTKVAGMLDKYHGSPQYFLGGIQFYFGMMRNLALLGYVADNATENEEFRSWAAKYYAKYQDRLLKGYEYQLYPPILYMPRSMALLGFTMTGTKAVTHNGQTSVQQTDAGIDLINQATAFMHFKIKIKLDANGHADDGGALRCLLNAETEIFCSVTLNSDNIPCYNWVGTQGNSIKFSVDAFQFQNKNGKLSYTGDKTFTTPFTLTLTLCEQNRLFGLSFSKFGPSPEKLTATASDGTTHSVNGSNIIRSLWTSIMSEASTERYKNYEGQSKEMEDLANRAQAHTNDPAYWNTPQGKKDAALLKELKVNFGAGQGAGAPSMSEGLGRIVAPFMIGTPQPVNYTLKTKLATRRKADSGGGWDDATVTVTLTQMTDHSGDIKQ